MTRPLLTDLTRERCFEVVQQVGLPRFRGEQLFRWIHHQRVRDPAKMSNLPASLRSHLEAEFGGKRPEVVFSSDAGSTTEKALVRLTDERTVEAVLILEGDRSTACLSSQAGCPVACRFCASGTLGLDRNLSVGEIVFQYHALADRAAAAGRRVGNVVLMGMGEPMLNLPAVLDALAILHDPAGPNVGARHLTISTVGLEKGIDRLRSEGKKFTLAFSLHAPDDALRRHLIPFPGALDIAGLREAALGYLADTGREVTFEYVLLAGVNDAPFQARQLADVLAGIQSSVNLIPYNVNPGLPFERPTSAVVDHFAEIARRGGLKVTVRKRKGDPILAACGQLRLRDIEGRERTS